MYARRLEASVVSEIYTQLDNLGWVVDEKSVANNGGLHTKVTIFP